MPPALVKTWLRAKQNLFIIISQIGNKSKRRSDDNTSDFRVCLSNSTPPPWKKSGLVEKCLNLLVVEPHFTAAHCSERLF